MNPMALPIGFPSESSKEISAASGSGLDAAGQGFVPEAVAVASMRSQSSCLNY